jgi:hypothetical protein
VSDQPIEQAVVSALATSSQPLTVRAIHARVEEALDASVAYSAVTNAASRLTVKGGITRLEPGLYSTS